MIKRKSEFTTVENGELKVVKPVAAKNFVRLKEGAVIYSMGLNSFRELAKDAGAIYHVKKMVLANTEIFDEFLEAFRDEENM